MKFSSQEEYGLRCLLRIARDGGEKGLTIPEISQMEGLTIPNAAKLLRLLRLGGFLESSRGQSGGYSLSKAADKIPVGEVLGVLGGKLYDKEFCSTYSGNVNICTNSIDCSIRSIWQTVQLAVDEVLNKITLKDLLGDETSLVTKITGFNKELIDLSN